ncbi:MAG: anaerobic sulfatase maturase [Flaviflexus sp.]|nr:anaerobic sulfatase maturase [Flaviflexus sp.]
MSVVAKPTGAACNLDCQYCFFLSKELLYDAPRQLMTEEVLDRYVAEYLAASPDGEVTMLWQGGEPTLRGLPFFRRLIELCEIYRRPSQQVVHALQTNATLIDEEWAAFLAEHDVLVGVSMDGPDDIHDAYRVNKAGRGTHAMVLRGWNYLRAAGVRCNILCTVHHANEDRGAEVYRYFRDELGATYLQFIPIVERVEAKDLPAAEAGWRTDTGARLLYQQTGDAVTSRSVNPKKYGRFLLDVFNEWIARDVGEVFVQDFDSALSSLFGQYSVCVHAPECGNNLAMEFNGDVYACDHWVEPDWKLGNIAESPFAELAATDTMRAFSRKKNDQLTEQCRRCPVRRMCNGGCPKDRFTTSVDGEAGQNYLCEGFYNFYSTIKPDLVAMARLIRENRAPADIMDPDVRRSKRPKVK